MHGCFPSHLIFFLRHSSQALVTLRRFCSGMLGAPLAPEGPAEGSSDSDLLAFWTDDLTLSEGEPASRGDSSADSSSDMASASREPATLEGVSLERCEGWEGGRVGREPAPSVRASGGMLSVAWVSGRLGVGPEGLGCSRSEVRLRR